MSARTTLAVALEDIDGCFQGIVPSAICSLSADGKPNVTNLSLVHRIDADHVGLSRQFFNKTVRNMVANPRLQVLVVEPNTGHQFRLDLVHEDTLTEGPQFDRMEARLDVVASQSGMEGVFRLRGVDVCRVTSCEQVPGPDAAVASPTRALERTARLDACSRRIVQASTVDELMEAALRAFDELFDYDRSIYLAADAETGRLYTVASRGFEPSGVGAEVEFEVGVIGVAASRRRTVRVVNAKRERLYSTAMRSTLSGPGEDIRLPQLDDVMSELAVPIVAREKLLGVFNFQSATPGRFTAEDEDLASVVARQIGLMMVLLQMETVEVSSAKRPVRGSSGAVVKYYPADDSIFVDDEYLIKGVAGRLLWRLLGAYLDVHQTEFTNRQLRLDASLELPGYKDNLETRLILLRKRLVERCDALAIESTGRGKFRLVVNRELELQVVR